MATDLIKPAQITPLQGPPQAERDALAALERLEANHLAALAGLDCLQRVEVAPAAASAPLALPLTIAAWNLERCYDVEKSADLIAATGAGIALLSEMDNGMARTRQRHTARDVASLLGMSHAYGVEFLELELGGETELAFCEDDFNLHGFHGNAVLARSMLQAPAMIRLERHGHWFTPETPARRIGTRCAVAAVVATTQGPLYVVSVHLENRADAAYRETQMRGMLDAVDSLAGDMPAVVGGDLNTGLADGGDFEKETLFAHADGRGYERHGGPLEQMSTRASRVTRNPTKAFKLDWFLTRGVEVTASRLVPSVAPDGDVLSDHDMVVLEIGGLKRQSA